MAYKINVLVTGSNGQLGNEIQRNAKDFESKFQFYFTDVAELDITKINDIDLFIKEKNIHYIINCAAYTAVDKAEDDVELCYLINKDAPNNLGTVAKQYEVKVIHISTDYVFDGTATRPYVETDPVSPRSIYGKSKEEGEQALLRACPESIIIRTSWLYSIFGNNFVKTMIRLGKEKEALNVVADQTGTPTNAGDLAQAILTILSFSEENHFIPGIYHYSNEGITTWFDFTVAIHRAANIDTCKVSPITTDQYPTKAERPQYSVLDKSKIKNTFNLSIPQWEDSMTKCVEELMQE